MSQSESAGTPDQIVLLHLSDVHIGTALMPASDGFHRFSSGYNPHDFRLLRPLERAVADGRRRVQLPDSATLNVVISGDLTQSGEENDYATAMALIHTRWQWVFGPSPQLLGFHWARDHTFIVPGNHDHWGHPKFPVSYRADLAPAWFEPTPWKKSIDSPGGTLRLELFGVDSNSGLQNRVNPGGLNLFAGGAISSTELDHLEDRLDDRANKPPPERAVVRVVICHHAFSNAGGFFAARPLSQDSRERLLSIAAPRGVTVALTGHTHSFHVQDWRVVAGHHTHVVKELRCATTLQGTRAAAGLQGFWLHRIVRTPGSATCRWTAWKYQVGAKQFDCNTSASITFPVRAL
jgi:3',5'-cyclic AMP phosphodiesterase CpdA